jgi:lipocalin
MVNNQTVKQLEIEKFLGQWYEIARFPHSFEKNLVGVTANYSINNDGKIKVINQGYKDSLHGKIKTAVGKAKIPNPELPGNLKVSFFWIFYSDYLVMELDSIDYQWAVIGSSSPDYLWILSRTPQMDEDIYQNLIQKIKKRGYDLSKIIRVEQAQSN